MQHMCSNGSPTPIYKLVRLSQLYFKRDPPILVLYHYRKQPANPHNTLYQLESLAVTLCVVFCFNVPQKDSVLDLHLRIYVRLVFWLRCKLSFLIQFLWRRHTVERFTLWRQRANSCVLCHFMRLLCFSIAANWHICTYKSTGTFEAKTSNAIF